MEELFGYGLVFSVNSAAVGALVAAYNKEFDDAGAMFLGAIIGNLIGYWVF